MRKVNKWLTGFKALLLAGSLTSPVLAQGDPAASAWAQAQRADTLEAYESFLEAHPLAPQAPLAFRRLIDLSIALEPAAGPEGRQILAEIY